MQFLNASWFHRGPRAWFASGLIVTVAGVILALPRVLEHFLYQPIRLTEADADPRRWGVHNAEVLHIPTEDGVHLYGWWLSQTPGHTPACGTAIMFYGNKGNLASQRVDADSLVRHGLDVLLFDYRGYGASPGTPSETGLYADAKAAYQYARIRTTAPDRIFLIGHSLGASVATHVAAHQQAAGLILVAPFTSLLGAGRARISGIADFILARSELRFNSIELIGRVRMPVLMLLGTKDRLIPGSDARVLYAAAPQPKTWVEVPNAGHNDVFNFRAFWDNVERFVHGAVRCKVGRT